MLETSTLDKTEQRGISRRRFFGYAGALAGAGLLASSLTGCQPEADTGVNVGSGDSGVFNYLYVLARLKAAIYVQSDTVPFVGMTSQEKDMFKQLRLHSIAHREFYNNLLGGAGDSTEAMEYDLTSIDFKKRTPVLDAIIKFEDLSVGAYNGAAQLMSSPDNLKQMAKIASVLARHAAAARDLKLTGTFADDTVVNDANGLDLVSMPYDVLPVIQPFIKTTLDFSTLPTS
jgi:hypothetical protein